MTRRELRRSKVLAVVLLMTTGLVAAWTVFPRPEGSGKALQADLAESLASHPRLVRIEPLPAAMNADGEMCQWVPASSQERLVAVLQQERMAARALGAGAAADPGSSVSIERAPARVIRDPYPTYSAVALDLQNNEIILQDENLFQIMTYDRTTNTPPSASMSEPKRVIGGHHTKVEFNCGLYVDPVTGDIYSVNNDTIDTLVIFNRDAKGDVPPTRELSTPHRTYGIAVDEANEEMFLTVQSPPHVVVYNKYAKGDDKPIRILRGNKTQLEDAHGIALDTKNGWMFVANYGNVADFREESGPGEAGRGGGGTVPGSGRYEPPSITAYPIKAQGDTAPLRVIEGPKTQLNWPAHLFLDEEHGEIYVANDGDHSVLVFKVTDSGDVAPSRMLKGPKTQIKNPTGVFVDKKNDEIIIANMGNHRATVFPRTARGDVAPVRVIRGGPEDQPSLQIGNPGAVAYDSKRDEILVPN